MEQKAIGIQVQLRGDFSDVEDRVVAALKEEGFGVLTEIDVKSTLKTKLDVDFRPYKILGACNPPLAHQVLLESPEAGMLLPCNVTLSEVEPGVIEVNMLDPLVIVEVLGNPNLAPIAEDAASRLRRTAESLKSQ